MKRDAAYYREYRARRKAKPNPHEACDARIAALEARIRELEASQERHLDIRLKTDEDDLEALL